MISMDQKSMIHAIAEQVHELGGQALLVGGCVRDEILGIPCYDIDCEVHGVEPEALGGQGRDLFVTPREIDVQVSTLAKAIGYGINLALQPHLTLDDLEMLLE